MLLANSRYRNGRRFEPDESGTIRCKGIRERVITPAIGVVEHVIEAGDRLDLLAHRYYNDARLWFRILDANPDLTNGVECSLSRRVGEVILIPKAKE